MIDQDPAYVDVAAALDLPSDDSMLEQIAVLVESLRIYKDRRDRYGDAWKMYGWTDSLFHVRNKMTRLDSEFWRTPPEDHEQALARLDNARDMINYLTFFIRNVEADNERGEQE